MRRLHKAPLPVVNVFTWTSIIHTSQHADEQLKALEFEHSEAEKVHVQAVSELKHAREELSKLQKRRQALISSIDDSATSHADKVLIAFLDLRLFSRALFHSCYFSNEVDFQFSTIQ